jgi:hypothetical protein
MASIEIDFENTSTSLHIELITLWYNMCSRRDSKTSSHGASSNPERVVAPIKVNGLD